MRRSSIFWVLSLALVCTVAILAAGPQAGDEVDVLWKGAWFRASVQQAGDGKVLVHYKGWDSSFDEWVTPERIREPLPLKPGTALEVEWKGKWFKAVIVEAGDGKYKIHYDGYGDNWDEWVTFRRMRFHSLPPGWKVGDPVQANWKGAWYKATIIGADGARYKIHYDGYGDNWDEWVGPDRIKAR